MFFETQCIVTPTRGHFRSVTKMAVTPFDSPYPQSPLLQANFMALCFIEPELLPLEVLHCRNRNSCGLEDLDRMISIYELEPYPLEVQYMYGVPDVRK